MTLQCGEGRRLFQGFNIARVALLLCAALTLAGCTFSDALKHNEVWSTRPAQSGEARRMLFVTDRELVMGEEYGVGRHWAAVPSCGSSMVTAFAQASATYPSFEDCVAPGDGGAGPSMAQGVRAPLSAIAGDIAAEAASRKCNSVLLYIHGYNTVFRTALLHAGQLASDVKWNCAAALFSWSSEGQYDRYAADIERSAYSVPVLINLLRAVAEKGITENIVAHSMGARITLNAIAALEPFCRTHNRKIVKQLILAAPDVSAEHDNDDFRHLLIRAAACAERATIYASDNDVILIASEGIHGGIPRAGRIPDKNLQYGACDALAADIVDASLAPGDKLGHGYFINSYEMMDDIRRALAGESLAARTGGKPTTLERRLPDGTVACRDANGQPVTKAAERYALIVAPDRQPSWGSRILRRVILPLIIPVQ